jgi:hypothetical protein
LADRYLVGQAAVAVDDADPDGDPDADAARGDAAAVALDDVAGEAVADAAIDAVADEPPVFVLAGDEATDDAPEVHPATLIPTATAAAAAAAETAARRLVDLVEPNIADLFPRPRCRS